MKTISLFSMIKPLIYSSDIKAISKKAQSQCLTRDEMDLMRMGDVCAETKVQTVFVNILKGLAQELSFTWRGSKNNIVIAQRDNGAASKSERFKKAREGTLPGMPDLEVWIFNAKTSKKETIFIESKRIDVPSKVGGDKEHSKRQLQCQEMLRNMDYPVYLTNNPVFVKRVICEEIRAFFN